MAGKTLLQIENLKTCFHTPEGVVKALDGVEFNVPQGKTLCIVGESGCGKSVTALSIMRLVPDPPGRISGGRILFEGKNLLSLSNREMRKIRGNRISMIFQEPMTSLNPVFSIGFQISEVLRLHQGISRREALTQSVEALRRVGIPSPEKRVHDYPHQLSGGMRQRVMIAMAFSCNPALLIADEPTTALDVTIQAQVLREMLKLKEETGASVLLITHNLGVVSDAAQEVIVMYAGRIVEQAGADEFFDHPCHPYTAALMRSIPRLDAVSRAKSLYVIPGMVPSPLDLPPGCKFNNRCEHSSQKCREIEPALREVSPGHTCRCWLFDGKADVASGSENNPGGEVLKNS